MPDSLYQSDFHQWALEQSAKIRERAAEHPKCFEGIDITNVAEEIEDLGNSERKAVASNLTRAIEHMIKITMMPDSDFSRGWTSEVVAMLRNARRSYTPSMRQRLSFSEIWSDARSDALQNLQGDGINSSDVSTSCPIDLDDFLDESIVALDMVEKFKERIPTSRSGSRPPR